MCGELDYEPIHFLRHFEVDASAIHADAKCAAVAALGEIGPSDPLNRLPPDRAELAEPTGDAAKARRALGDISVMTVEDQRVVEVSEQCQLGRRGVQRPSLDHW